MPDGKRPTPPVPSRVNPLHVQYAILKDFRELLGAVEIGSAPSGTRTAEPDDSLTGVNITDMEATPFPVGGDVVRNAKTGEVFHVQAWPPAPAEQAQPQPLFKEEAA